MKDTNALYREELGVKKAAIAFTVMMVLFLMPCSLAELYRSQPEIDAYLPDSEPTTYAPDKPLISLREFASSFHFAAYLLETGHTISVESADELTLIGDHALLKMIYNGCEILSLTLDDQGYEIISIKCTHANNVPGSDKFLDDYTILLMETMYGCGVDMSSVLDVIRGTGFFDHADYGDRGEYTIDNLKVTYEVSRIFGLTFTFART